MSQVQELGHGRARVGGQTLTLAEDPVCACSVTSVVSASLQPRGLQPAGLLCPWDSPGKNTGAGCHALLQGIFSTQGSNLCLIMFPALTGGFFTTSTTLEAQQRASGRSLTTICSREDGQLLQTPARGVLENQLSGKIKITKALICCTG